MAESETSHSESSENSAEEIETPKDGGAQKKMSDYEKQRMKRIEENRARMEALGLKTMAKSLMGSAPKVKKRSEKKGKRKVGYDDDEYRPAEDDDEGSSSSAEEDNEEDEDEDEDFAESRKNKGKKKTKTPKKPMPKKRVQKHKLLGEPDYVDDDDALMQAIALSLQDSSGFLNVKTQASQSSDAHVPDSSSNLKKKNAQIHEDSGKRKRKKTIRNRVQMTEDEVIIHFFQFDEAGKGNISMRDLQRVAAGHDFMWSDQEMADMINCFDSDGDGKLSLDDFRKIAGRCNLVQVPETAVMDKV